MNKTNEVKLISLFWEKVKKFSLCHVKGVFFEFFFQVHLKNYRSGVNSWNKMFILKQLLKVYFFYIKATVTDKNLHCGFNGNCYFFGGTRVSVLSIFIGMVIAALAWEGLYNQKMYHNETC